MTDIELKNERRRLIVEELKKVPEGERIKINKDLLEDLLFDIDNVYGYKFPTWTGDFLSKIDLSEISFKDVSFDGEAFCETDLVSDEFKFFEFKNTNAVIDVDKIQEPGGLAYCDFSGTKVVGKLVSTYKCNFANCGLTANNFSANYHGSGNNFMGNDLSKLVLNDSIIVDGIDVSYDLDFSCFTGTGAILPKKLISKVYSALCEGIDANHYSDNELVSIITNFKGCNDYFILNTVEEDLYNGLIECADNFLLSDDDLSEKISSLRNLIKKDRKGGRK